MSILIYAIMHEYSSLNHTWPKAFSQHEKVASMASNEQQKIGWTNILQGMLSKKWALCQHYYLQEMHKSQPIPSGTYEIWKKSFIPTLIQFGLELWELWNGKFHGTTPQETAYIRQMKLNKEISKKFSMGQKSVSPAQRRLFQKPEILRLHDPNHSKQNWITSVSIAQQARKQQLEKLYASYPRLDWFEGFFSITILPPSPSCFTSPSPSTPPRKTKYIQKTLRELFLNVHPNVR